MRMKEPSLTVAASGHDQKHDQRCQGTTNHYRSQPGRAFGIKETRMNYSNLLRFDPNSPKRTGLTASRQGNAAVSTIVYETAEQATFLPLLLVRPMRGMSRTALARPLRSRAWVSAPKPQVVLRPPTTGVPDESQRCGLRVESDPACPRRRRLERAPLRIADRACRAPAMQRDLRQGVQLIGLRRCRPDGLSKFLKRRSFVVAQEREILVDGLGFGLGFGCYGLRSCVKRPEFIGGLLVSLHKPVSTPTTQRAFRTPRPRHTVNSTLSPGARHAHIRSGDTLLASSNG